MDEFLELEVAAGHINGPFTVAQAHTIFGGHFNTAPLGLIKKPGSTTLWMIFHHSKEDHLGQSTNGWLYPSIHATRYFSAADAADFVSFYSAICYAPSCHVSHYPKTHMYLKQQPSTFI